MSTRAKTSRGKLKNVLCKKNHAIFIIVTFIFLKNYFKKSSVFRESPLPEKDYINLDYYVAYAIE